MAIYNKLCSEEIDLIENKTGGWFRVRYTDLGYEEDVHLSDMNANGGAREIMEAVEELNGGV